MKTYLTVNIENATGFKTWDIVLILSKEFLDIKATIECKITLKHVRGMIRTYNQI